MAKKNPTSPSRALRNPESERLQDKIEFERSRLMTAEAILHCLAIAMDECDSGEPDSPDYPSLIDLSRSLVRQSIDELDSVRVKPLMSALGVKESAAAYVH